MRDRVNLGKEENMSRAESKRGLSVRKREREGQRTREKERERAREKESDRD